MSIELRPLGVACNIRCRYCYQNPQRDAGNLSRQYDIDRMMEAVSGSGSAFTLFGGEPLLLPLADLERLWAFGLSRHGRNTVQTNGTILTDEHLRLFKKYRVHVGISIDGPGALNDARWAGSLEATRTTTSRAERNIERLCDEGMAPSLIATLHRVNADAARLPLLCDWIRALDRRGVTSMRLHILEVDAPDVRRDLALSTSENVAAFTAMAALEPSLTKLRFDIFRDLRRLLLGEDDGVTCVWRSCDPYTTPAVQGVEGSGQRSNCGRTNKLGVDFVKARAERHERYLALHRTPQQDGGCSGCSYFLMCRGQCPGTAIDGDWRNRSEHCDVWKALFARVEARLVAEGRTPISLDKRRPALERVVVDGWTKGRNLTTAAALRQLTADAEAPRKLSSDARFTRVGWVSDAARAVWEPRLARVAAAVLKIGADGPVREVPPCCAAAWRTPAGEPDPTWRMATAASAGRADDVLEVSGPAETNMLWRWIGVKAVPHMPCRFDCEASAAVARTFCEDGRRAGFGEEMDWLLEILAWPAQVSMLHGIAEVLTPILRISTAAAYTPSRRTVRRAGDGYPLEGGRGVAFPFVPA